MTYSVSQIAEMLGAEFIGDGNRVINRVLPINEATADSITFVADARVLPKLQKSNAGAVVVPAKVAEKTAEFVAASGPIPAIVVPNALETILQLANVMTPPAPSVAKQIDPRAAVDPSVKLGPDCAVGAFAVIEQNVVLGRGCIIHPHAVVRADCQLGDDVEIHPHAVLYPRTILGDRVKIHAGTVVGSDGFGYVQQSGKHVKIPQLGRVVIEHDVEIGANSTIDRAMLGTTKIGQGSKIDNQVQVAHNCHIGPHNILIAQAGIAGSSSTGSYVIMAGQSGCTDHVHLGDQVIVGARSGVIEDVPPKTVMLGSPAKPEREAKRLHLAKDALPDVIKQVKQICRQLGIDGPKVTRKGREEQQQKAANDAETRKAG